MKEKRMGINITLVLVILAAIGATLLTLWIYYNIIYEEREVTSEHHDEFIITGEIRGLDAGEVKKYDNICTTISSLNFLEREELESILVNLQGKISDDVMKEMLYEQEAYKLAREEPIVHEGNENLPEIDYAIADDYEWPLYGEDGNEIGTTPDIDEYIQNQKDVFQYELDKNSIIGDYEVTGSEELDITPEKDVLILADGLNPERIVMKYRQEPGDTVITYVLTVENNVVTKYEIIV